MIKATVPDNVGFVEVARLNVPAGRYVVIAKAVALVSGSKTLGVTAAGCLLKVGAAGLNGQLAAEQASDLSSANLVTGNGVGSATATLVTTVANEFAPRGTLRQAGGDLAALLARGDPVATTSPSSRSGSPRSASPSCPSC